MALGLADKPLDPVYNILKGLYVTGQQESSRVFKNYIFKVLLEGLVQGILIFFLISFSNQMSKMDDGKTFDYNSMQL